MECLNLFPCVHMLNTLWETLPSGVDNLEISININISIPQHLPIHYSPREGSLNILSRGIQASVCPFAVEPLKRTDFGIVRASCAHRSHFVSWTTCSVYLYLKQSPRMFCSPSPLSSPEVILCGPAGRLL